MDKRGATGTYGAVAEPCNSLSKFPDPEILVRRYLAGTSLLGAYWSSVEMPGQGVFVGDLSLVHLPPVVRFIRKTIVLGAVQSVG